MWRSPSGNQPKAVSIATEATFGTLQRCHQTIARLNSRFTSTKENMSAHPESEGELVLIATPIGNLSDLSNRARSQLSEVDYLACEDTRVTGTLIARLELPKKPELVSYREENEKIMAPQLADRIERGERVGLVADAGMPAISDPGFRLVRECRSRGLTVTAVPGATAAITAIAISGLPTDGFLFIGFLPPKKSARKRFFENYAHFEYTIVVYESCHRIVKCLDDLIEVLGPQRNISLSREMTKLHETVLSGPAEAVRTDMLQRSQKGEFVLCIAKQGFDL